MLVDVHLDQLDLAVGGPDRLLDDRCQLTAGPAPWRPEVDQHRLALRFLDDVLHEGLGGRFLDQIGRRLWRRPVALFDYRHGILVCCPEGVGSSTVQRRSRRSLPKWRVAAKFQLAWLPSRSFPAGARCELCGQRRSSGMKWNAERMLQWRRLIALPCLRKLARPSEKIVRDFNNYPVWAGADPRRPSGTPLAIALASGDGRPRRNGSRAAASPRRGHETDSANHKNRGVAPRECGHL